MNRQKILLLLVGFLGVIRFVVMPVNDALDEKRTELARLNEKLQKSERLVEEVELLSRQSQKVEDGLSLLKNRFTTTTSEEQARLDFQNALENKASENKVKIESLEWTYNAPGTPAMSQVDLKIDAKLKNFMLFHSDISNLGFGVVTSDMQLSVDRQLLSRSRLGDISGQVSFRIFYLVDDE